MRPDPTNASVPQQGALAIFIDYDGTITDVDTFDVLVRNASGDALWEELDGALVRGEVSLREALRRQALTLTGTQAEALEFLSRVATVDPTFTPFLAAAQAKGATATILSAGIGSLMRANLTRAGVPEIPILANDVVYDPNGWIMTFRDATDNGHDKAVHVRDAAARGERTVFVGDGLSDYAAAEVAHVRFAKKGRALERYLAERGLAFTTFARFDEIERALFATG